VPFELKCQFKIFSTALANEVWMKKLEKTAVAFLEGGVSDHSPALIIVGNVKSFGPKQFQIFSYTT
jgi:hypothetical protein